MSELSLDNEWIRVIAHAWKDEAFMARLNEEPKTTLEDDQVRQDLNLSSISGDCDGGFPLPEVPDDLKGKTEQEIRSFLEDPKNVEPLFALGRPCIIRP